MVTHPRVSVKVEGGLLAVEFGVQLLEGQASTNSDPFGLLEGRDAPTMVVMAQRSFMDASPTGEIC
jgi:hypothetical protein